jgi:PAS domain S-box-containing protein
MHSTVLSVDDDAALRGVRNEVVRAAGFEVVEAASGAEALKLASEKLPALVMAAIELPDMDGLALCRRLKADPHTASIPVLHISRSGESRRDYPDSIESGADAWLREPLDPPVLISVAKALIRAGSRGKEENAPSNGRLLALIDSIPDEVWFADAQSRFTLANPSALREFNIGASGLAGVEEMAKGLEVYRADGSPRPVEEAPPLRALNGETVRDQEELIRTPVHEELRCRQVSASPVRDAAGHIVGSVSVVRDITEKKRAEQALKASEERYRTLFETMSEGFALDEIICDEAGKPYDLRYLAVNPAFERQTGLKAVDILGRTVLELFPKTEPVWIERYGKVALSGEPARFEEWFGPLGRWFEVSAFQTAPGRFGVVFTDITERKRREEERQRLAAALEAMALFPEQNPSPTLRVGGDGALLYANRSAHALTAEWNCQLGQTVPGDLRRAVEEALAQGAPSEFDVRAGGCDYSFLIAPIAGCPYANLYGRDITERKRAEMEIARQARLLGQACEPMFAWDLDGAINYWNNAAETLYGFSRGEAMGRFSHELLRTENPIGMPQLDAILASAGSWRGDLLHTAKDGRRILVETVMAVVADLDGRRVVLETARDITERKRTEEALRASQEQNRFLADLLERADQPFGVGYLDGRLGFVNSAFERLTGYSRDELQGLDWAVRLTPSEWLEAERGKLEELQRTGQPVRYEKEYLRKDGTRVPIELLVHLVKDRQGQPFYYSFLTDLTERKRAEKALRESEEQFRTLANAIPQLCWMANADGWIFWYNRRWYEYTGATPEQMEGWGWQSVHDPEALPKVLDHWKASIATGEPFDMVFPLRGADGVFRPFLTRIMPVRDRDGKVAGWFGTNTDISEQRKTEEALRESEAVLRSFFDSPGVMRGIVELIDSRIVHVSCNAAAAEMFGVDRQSIGGKSASEAGAPQKVARKWVGLYEKSRRTGKSVSMEYARRDADGRERWLLATAGYLGMGPSGHPQFAYTILDLTDRQQAEERLRQSEERYRMLFDTMIEGFCIIEVIFDADNQPVDYRFLEINPAFEAQTGLKNARGRLMRELAPDHEAHWFEIYGQVALTGEPARFVNEARALDRWYDVSAYRVGDPESRRVAILFNDITERKRVEEALRESDLRERARAVELEALMDAAPAAIFVSRDVECRSMTGNRAAHELLRRPAGLNLSKSAPEGERPVNFWAMKNGVEIPNGELPAQKAASSGQPVRNYELDIVFEDGECLNLVGDATPLLDEDGKSRGSVAVLSNVTELKRAEARLREAQKLESLGLLAGGVAHDFNNLLVGVIGNASLAREVLPPDNPAAELLEGVIQAGDQAAHLTRQMLAYSGKGRFLVEPLNLSALIPEMTGLVRPSISKKIALHLNLDDYLPPIEADRGQVQQVFMNLALNAAESIGSHDGLISVHTGVEDVDDRYLRLHPGVAAPPPGKYVCLEVRDTGCGMDDATMARIFDPFFSTKFTGRGLGLAAVAGILRGHGGGIAVTSAPGKGSCFTALFPAAARPAPERPAADRDATLQGAGVVLVVDDEKVVREMAKKALERQGYTVLLADSGLAAIDVLRRHPGDIALVILDLSMPKMSGEEALPELRKIRPQVKVVVSSGYSETEAMTLFKGQQVSGFIQKPYTSRGIAEKVKVCIG